jgi:hypothetical protein
MLKSGWCNPWKNLNITKNGKATRQIVLGATIANKKRTISKF